jgi:glycosyltransferase involved in cell wall biosynthesis
MNKIMQLIQHPYLGGLEKMAYSLCNTKMNDSKMYLMSLEGNKNKAIKNWSELKDLENFDCLDKKEKFDWNVVEKLVEFVDKNKIDIIHSHHIGPLLYGSLLKIRRPKLKHVHTIHDAWYLSNKKYRFLTKSIQRLTSVTIISDAVAVAEVVKETAKINSDYIILNGINTKYFSPISKHKARSKLNLPQNEKLIGCAARVEKGKGHKTLIKTLLKLPEKTSLVFAGEGSQKEKMKDYAKKIKVSHRIYWLGNVSQMPTFYSAIDTFCLFSEKEGLPLSVLEAMSCNRPVVVSDVGGLKEVVNNDLGFIVPLNKESLLFKYLITSLKFNYGSSIRQYALNKVNIKTMLNNYNSIYKKLMI